MTYQPYRSEILRPASRRLPAAAILLAMLVLPAAAAQLEIPETAPDGEPTGWCGTGRLEPSEYQQQWSGWRRYALGAQDAGDPQCEGLALSELALLTEQPDLGYLGKDYWQAALTVLEPAVGRDDPRLVQVLLSLSVHRRDPERGNAEAEALVLHAVEILETHLARPLSWPPLPACGPVPEAPPGDVTPYFSIEYQSKTRLEHQRENLDLTLADAFQRLAGLRSEAGHYGDAIAALDRSLDMLETRERQAAEKLARRDLTWRAQSIIRQLADVAKQDPPAAIAPSIVERGVGLVRRNAGGKADEMGRALGTLAEVYVAYDLLFAEKAGDPSPVLLWGKARVLLAGRRHAEAEDLYRRAEATILADPGAHRANLANPRQGLARIAAASGDRDAALTLLRTAAESFEETYPEDPERLARGLREVAGTSRELGFEEEAERLEARAASEPGS